VSLRPGSRSGTLPGLARWVVLVVAGCALNVVWELGQASLYAGRPPWWVFLRAAVSDALFIGAATLLGVLARRLWPGGFWPVFLLVLVATAAVIELRALAAGRWAYAEAMPTVFTVGLSPLVQLGLTGAVAVLVAWRGTPGGPGRSR